MENGMSSHRNFSSEALLCMIIMVSPIHKYYNHIQLILILFANILGSIHTYRQLYFCLQNIFELD